MNVHFASLVCVDFDLDLLPHWIPHYARYGFDSYRVWLHSPSDDEGNLTDGIIAFRQAGWKYDIVTGEFRKGSLRERCLGPYAESLPPKDRLVVADSDEIQSFDADEYRVLAQEHDVIYGIMVDRFAAPQPQFAMMSPIKI